MYGVKSQSEKRIERGRQATRESLRKSFEMLGKRERTWTEGDMGMLREVLWFFYVGRRRGNGGRTYDEMWEWDEKRVWEEEMGVSEKEMAKRESKGKHKEMIRLLDVPARRRRI